MRAVKAVKQNYVPTPEILKLLDEFRKMVNDCLRIGLSEHITSLKRLSKRTYHNLSRYPVHANYRLTAISAATGLLRNYRRILKDHPKGKVPFVWKPYLVDCYAFRIEGARLKVPLKARQYVYIPLTSHTLRCISGYTIRSVLLTARTMSIAFSKETAETASKGLIGIDRNLDNVTTATLEGETEVYDLSKATKAKALYREIISHFKRDDVRVRKQVSGKYGLKQRNKVQPIIHKTTRQIIEKAKANHFGIVMENLTGIRKLYRKGNGQGQHYRSRLNMWSYYEFQRQIEYKAKWEGIPVIYVQPQGTSSTCAICGSSVTECTERKVWCGKCQRLVDRDENAALNIVNAALRFEAKGLVSETMMGNENASNEATLLLRGDTSKLTTLAEPLLSGR